MHACTATLSAPNPAAGHCWPKLLTETLGHSQASLGNSLVGSLLLSLESWCTQVFVCAFQESVSPVLSKFWWLYGGVNGNHLQEGLWPRSAAPRALASAAIHCWPIPLQKTFKHSSFSISVGSVGSGAHKVCSSPLSISGGFVIWF